MNMKYVRKEWPGVLLLLFFAFGLRAQTITGSVFFDGNNNGIKDATEVGYHGVTVKAYDASNNEAASATSAALTGDYTLNGLTAGQKYRVEFTYLPPANPAPSIFGSNSGTSVQFATAGASSVNFSIHVPSESFTDSNPRLIAGCGIGGVGQNGQPTDPSVASWLYNSNYPIDIPTQSQGDANSQFTLYASVIHPHSEDLRANQVGIPFGLGVQPKTKLVFMSTLSSPFTTVFPAAPDGPGAIYVADYSGPSGAFVQYKLFTTIANTAGTTFFGKYGLGGVDFSQDGKNLFTVNLGNGKLVKIPVTGTDFASITAGTASEITIPSTFTTCTGGTFRPTALKEYGGKLYLGAICDAGDLKVTIISYDYTADVWKEELTFLASSFNAGNMIGLNTPQVAWEDPEGNNPDTTPKFAPVLTDIAFDDRGGMMIGVTNRKVLNNNSNYETGYVLRTWRNNDGTFTLENAGMVGPLTGNPYFLAWLQTNYAISSIGGPGGKWFFDQSMKFHPYVYNGGLFVCPGTNEVVWGASDPLSINSMGARYLSLTDGTITKGINLSGSKISRLTGMDAVVSGGAIEIGNLIWNDTNNNGRQDANETGISGVTVQLKNIGGTVIATATTDANGNYIFSSNPNLTDSPDGSRKYNLALTETTSYKICVAIAQGALTGKSLSMANNALDQIDTDATLVGANAEISLTTGVLGENNHSYDIGFGACVKPVVTATAKIQTVCEGSTVSAFTANSSTTGLTYQWYGPLTDTTSSLGTAITTAINAAYTPTTSAVGKHYFAVIGQNGDAACTDTAFVCLKIVAKANAGTDGNTTVCDKNTATIDLFGLITGEQTGGTWTRSTGTGGTFNGAAGTFKPAIGATTSTFKYTITGTAPCPDDEAIATVTVNAAPEITILGSPTCAANLTTYSVNFTATTSSVITSNRGTVAGNSVTGIPSGQTVEIYAELNGCKDTLTVTQNCACPTVNAPVGTGQSICQGDVIPQLSVTIDAGLQADWYDAATGGTLLQANSLTYTPTAGGTFYVEAKNATSGCKSATRTAVVLTIKPLPILSVTSTTCATNGLTFDVALTTNGTITSDKGTANGLTITGVPAGQTVSITSTLAGCSTTTTATKTCVIPCGAPDCLGISVTKN